MVSVGLFVGIDAPPERIVYAAQKNKPNEAATKSGPTLWDSALGKKLSGMIHRPRKPAISARASSTGGWNATPAWSSGSDRRCSCVG